MTADRLEENIFEMKEFANLVIRIALNHLNVFKHDKEAERQYNLLFETNPVIDINFEKQFETYHEAYIP